MEAMDKLIEFYRVLGWEVLRRGSPKEIAIWKGEKGTVKLLCDDGLIEVGWSADQLNELVAGKIEDAKKESKTPRILLALFDDQKIVEWAPL